MNKILVNTIVISAFATLANAGTLDSTHGDWDVYTDGGKSCYIASSPTKEDGNWKKRGQPYVLIYSKGQADEVNVSSGYPYKPSVGVEAKVDSKNFKLFSDGETAWAKDSKTDAQLVTWLRRGAKLEVKGVSKRGTYSVDTYSLKGVSAAYKRMKELCR